MHQFIDIQSWPLVYLHMPAQVADQDADAALAQITALYARAESFVLVLDGAQLPRHSVRFMRAYTQWSRKNLALQKCFCAGAVRIEAEPKRRHDAQRLQARNRATRSPYPSRIVASAAEAALQAQAWLDAQEQSAAGPAQTLPSGIPLHAELAAELALTPAQLPMHANLLQLGLDSMRIMAWQNRLRARGYALSLRQLYRAPSVAGWSQLCNQVGRVSDSGNGNGNAGNTLTASWPIMTDGQAFALTPVQHAYLIGRAPQQSLGGVACHLYQEFDGDGLTPHIVEAAIHALIARHPMLSVRFSADAQQQWCASAPWCGLTTHDLRALEGAAQEQALLTLRRQLDHRLLAVDVGETFDFQLSLLPAGRHRLHVNLDLLVIDAASFHLLFEELAALVAGTALAPISRAYDFRSYLAQLAQQGAAARQQAQDYWQARLSQLPPAPALPLLATKLVTQQAEEATPPRFVRHRAELDADQWQALQSAAAACAVTPTMALASCFGAVLARWSGQERLLLNLTLFDRQPLQPEVQTMIADFTNILLLDLDCRERDFATLARSNQETFAAAYEHRHWSGVEVLRALRKQGDYPHGVPVVFTSNLGSPLYGCNSAAVLGEPGWGISQTPQVWIDHVALLQGGALVLQWDSLDGLFPAGLIDTMFDAYLALVYTLVQERSAWQRPLVDPMPATQRAVRASINATANACARPVPNGRLHEGFFAAAERTPESVALHYQDEVVSYAQLAALARRCATALGEHGVMPGDRVAVSMHKGIGQVVAVLGTLYAGAIYVPVSLEQPLARRCQIYDNADVALVLLCRHDTAQPHEQIPHEQTPHYLYWQEAITAAEAATAASVDPHSAAYVIYTSGSTGAPKGVAISHRSALNTCAEINRRYRVSAADRVLALSALHFDLSVYDLFGVLAAGATIVLPQQPQCRDPGAWSALLERHRITLWNSVPALFDMLLTYNDGVAGQAPSTLRLVLLSGDWIGLDLAPRYRRYRQHASDPSELVALGGATEAAIWSNAFDVYQIAPHWRSIPYGYPLANQRYRVVDEQGRDCPDWVAGELWIGGAGVALGYFKDPQRSACQFVDGSDGRWYKTGDRGCYWPDGTLEFLGRRDRQVKIGGHRIELGEVEAGLHRIDGVKQAVALALGTREKSLIACIVPSADAPFAQCHAEAAVPRDYGVLWPSSTTAPGDSAAMTTLVADFLLAHLQQQGLYFTQPQPLAQLCQRYDAAPAWQAQFARWLHFLVAQQRLCLQDGCYLRGPRFEQPRWQPALADPLFSCAEALLAHHGALAAIMRGRRAAQTLLDHPFWAPEQLLLNSAGCVAALEELAQVIALLAERLQRPLHVIEIGARSAAGAHLLLRRLSPQQLRYTGLDASAEMVLRAQQDFAAAGFTHADMQRQQMLLPMHLRHSGDVICVHNCLHRLGSEALTAALALAAPAAMLHVLELDGSSNTALALVSADLLMTHTAAAGDSLGSAEHWRVLLQQHALDYQRQDRSGDQLRLVARAPTPVQRPDAAQLSMALAQQLPPYMLPRQLIFLEALPLSANGKLDHQALVACCTCAPEEQSQQQAPAGATEELLATLWRSLLQTESLHRHSHFFALGGDSLLATRLIGQLAQHGYTAQLDELFHFPTLAAFAATVSTPTDMTVQAGGLQPDPANRHAPFALTELQQAYLVGRQPGFPLSGVGAHFFVEFDVLYLDVARFESVWNRLIARHDMLRCVVRDGRQQVLPEVAHYVLRQHQLDSLDGVAATALRDRLAYQVLDPGRWPLFDLQAGTDGSGHSRLYLCLDNLMLDGMSMQILLAELEQLYLDPLASLAPLTLSFRDYQQYHAGVVPNTASLAYWQQRLATLPAAPQLPLRCDPVTCGKPHFVRLSGCLSASAWTTLKQRAAMVRLTPSALLLAAYAAVLSAWSKAPQLSLNLTLFERAPLHPQINQVLGDFTSLLLLAWHPDGVWLSSARRLQQRLWQDLAHRDVSALQVMRQLAQRQQRATVAMPVVFTSALGSTQERFLAQGSCFQPRWGISQTPQVWLDHQVYECEGELRFNWDAVQALFAPDTLCNMFDQYSALLERLAYDSAAWQLSLAELVPRAVSATANVAPAPMHMTGAAPAGVVDSALVNSLRTHFQQVVGVPIGAHSSFFEAGASSLKLVQLHAHLQQAGFTTLSVTDLFAYASPYALAAHFLAADCQVSTSRPVRSRRARRQGDTA